MTDDKDKIPPIVLDDTGEEDDSRLESTNDSEGDEDSGSEHDEK